MVYQIHNLCRVRIRCAQCALIVFDVELLKRNFAHGQSGHGLFVRLALLCLSVLDWVGGCCILIGVCI